MSENKQNRKKKFSEEFKLQAIELSKEIGLERAAKDLGIGVSSLSRWKSQLALNGVVSKKEEVKKSYSDLEKENRKLKKELTYMHKINDVLKKSTAIFSKDQIGDSK